MAGEGCVTCDPELLDCVQPGSTIQTLPLLQGLWRANFDLGQEFVLQCLNSDACVGGTLGTNGTYCAEGYEGPCEHLQL